MRRGRVIVGLLVFLSCALGQQTRPKVGLALEGGGALGMAHIGVLEWLETHRIPVDYVAGTSMGGLVGGMYAMGKSPREIHQLVDGINWDEVLRGEMHYKDLIFRRKEDQRAYPNSFELGLRDGLSLPGGLNAGQQIGMILDEATLPYSAVTNFDHLPIPYRCVATELSTNKVEVFSGGSLASAMRATMSIPGFFTPLRYNGKVYADGGLLNNLPVDVVKNMGADIVIAVHLQVKPYDPADISSPFATLGRAISVVIAVNELRSMEQADILVSVPLQDFSSTAYEKGAEILVKGKEAAAAKEKILSTLALSEEAYKQYRGRIESRRIKEIPTPQFVEVQGTRPELAQRIADEMKDSIGVPVDFRQLDKQITSVTGIGRFSKIDYTMVNRNGKSGLLVLAEEKSYSPPNLKPGVIIDGSDFNNVQFSVGARLTLLDLGGYRRELRSDLQVGSIYSIASEYYRPFSPTGKWFIAPRGFASDSPFPLYDEGSRVAEYRTRTAGGAIDIGITPNRFSEFRAGYRLYKQWFSRKIGDPLLPSIDGMVGALSARYQIDRLDSAVVPRSGYSLQSRMEWWDKNIGSTGSFPVAEAIASYFRPVSRPSSVYVQGGAGTTFGRNDVGFPVFSLGGVNRLGAYGQNEFLTNQYLFFKAGYLHQIGRMPVFLGNRIFGHAAWEIARPYDNQSTRLPTDGTLGVVVETLIGPVFLGGAVGDSGHRKIYFQIGRFF